MSQLAAVPANQADGLFERTVETLLDAAFDDARCGDAFRELDGLYGLDRSEHTVRRPLKNGLSKRARTAGPVWFGS